MENKDIYLLKSFSKIERLVHGFSTIAIGDIKKNDKNSLILLSQVLNISDGKLVGMNQVHGKNIGWVTHTNCGSILKETDGVFTKQKGLFLYGTFADCVPVLFYDKRRRIVGIAHVGWKGILLKIAKKAVLQMIKNGSRLSDIFIGIGPSIRVCCYNIDKERALLFKSKFPKIKDLIIQKRKGKFFLDLQTLLKFQLYSMGIKKSNIEDIGICTKESKDFYSNRRDHIEGGDCKVFAAIIGKV